MCMVRLSKQSEIVTCYSDTIIQIMSEKFPHVNWLVPLWKVLSKALSGKKKCNDTVKV